MSSIRVGFQGLPGAYSDKAVQDFFQHAFEPQYPRHPLFPASTTKPEFETLGSGTIETLLEKLTALPKSELDLAFIPIENTYSGTFTNVYDALMKYHNQIYIVGEWVSKEDHALLVLDDPQAPKSVDELEEIYSHSHVLEQCHRFVGQLRDKRRLKSQSRADEMLMSVHSVEDSAGAIAYLQKKKLLKCGAIASASAAPLYGCRVLQKEVGDVPETATRYLIIAPTSLTPSQLTQSQQRGGNKTSLAVLLKNSPGMLFKALSCFALRDINVTKIESRPSPRAGQSFGQNRSVWEYVNYIDVEGGTSEEKVRNALNNLQEYANAVKVLGSYPRFHGSSPSVPSYSHTYSM